MINPGNHHTISVTMRINAQDSVDLALMGEHLLRCTDLPLSTMHTVHSSDVNEHSRSRSAPLLVLSQFKIYYDTMLNGI